MAMKAASLACFDTDYSADCIEWCPCPGYEDVFVCGTYQVIEPTQEAAARSKTEVGDASDGTEESAKGDQDEDQPKGSISTQRTGRLLSFQVDPEPFTIQEVQRIETDAILDAKWFDLNGPRLAVADAKGKISIYSLTSGRRLVVDQVVSVGESSTLVLSLDIMGPLQSITEANKLAYSLSNGSLGMISLSNGHWEVEESWHGHDFEPWCIAWDKWEPHTIWSGGDDLKLKRWDTRSTSMPTFTNSRFEAGITTITSSPHTPHLLAVGSYDSYLRVYDTRSPRQALQEINVGGGVWRAKFHPDPERKDEMLIAAMHDGFKVVRLGLDLGVAQGTQGSDTWTLGSGEIVRRFEQHKSLAYGADWSRLPSSKDGSLIATCSFYDHSMHLWRG